MLTTYSSTAHGNLYGAGILHRAISNKTIFLGDKDAKVGDQGVLIDLSLAHDYLNAAKSDINKEPIIVRPHWSRLCEIACSQYCFKGDRFFQSCAILGFLIALNDDKSRALAPAHDYLDDLETIFFVLCRLLFGFHPNGEPREETDSARSVVEGWDSNNPNHSLALKNMLLSSSCRQQQLAIDVVGESWGNACQTLFVEFLNWVVKIQAEKARLLREDYPRLLREREAAIKKEAESKLKGDVDFPVTEPEAVVQQESVYAPLYLNAQDHYDELLDMFKRAIRAIDALPPDEKEAPKVVIPKPKPNVQPDARSRVDSATAAGPIPLDLKRRRISSMGSNNNGSGFKVPVVPPAKTTRYDEQGNGAAWMNRDAGPSDNPFN